MEHSLMEDDPPPRALDDQVRNEDPAEQGQENPAGDRDVLPAERRRAPDPLARQSER